ncbi:MAG: class II aldolase/adducin family protein [Pseudomonadota bacterium]
MNDLTLRADLAAVHRILAYEGLNEGTWLHLTARCTDGNGILVSPGDTHFSIVKATSLLHYSTSGTLISGCGKPNIDALDIHLPVYNARADVQCVLHLHPPHCVALACMKNTEFSPFASQLAGAFYGKVAYLNHFSIPRSSAEEGLLMVEALGDGMVLFMKSHGVLIAAKSLAEATMAAYTLERAARIQYLALSSGQGIAELKLDDVESLAAEECFGEPGYFEGMKAFLAEKQPDYAD